MKTEGSLEVTQANCANDAKDCTVQQYWTKQNAALLRTQGSRGGTHIDMSIQRVWFVRHLVPTSRTVMQRLINTKTMRGEEIDTDSVVNAALTIESKLSADEQRAVAREIQVERERQGF